jgi:hypothetical protein
MEEREVEEGDCLGVSEGDPAAVDGHDSAVVEVIVRLRTVRCGGMAVEAIFVVFSVGSISEMKEWKSDEIDNFKTRSQVSGGIGGDLAKIVEDLVGG